MTREQRDAHLRMLSTLPRRYHSSTYYETVQGKRFPDGHIPEAILRGVRELRQNGASVKVIRARLHIGPDTARKAIALADHELAKQCS